VLRETLAGRAVTSTLSTLAAVLHHRPDVLVIDLEMPGVDGLGAVAEIRRVQPDQVILMLTRHARPGVLRKRPRPANRQPGTPGTRLVVALSQAQTRTARAG